MNKSIFDSKNIYEIKTKDEIFSGNVMPNSDGNTIFLKLNSGYNIAIKKNEIKSVKLIKKIRKEAVKKEKIMQNNNLSTVVILHTGGTIASRVDYKSGAVESSFTPEDILASFPELKDLANIRSRLIFNVFSENMGFKHYNLLAKEIKKEADKGVKGIIVTHGTDTLAYTSAALSFILEDFPVPVILVGSQRSSDRGSSDAFLNLLSAVNFIVKTDFADVAICMHENQNDDSCVILPALKTRKLHSSRRDAFKAVNSTPYARVKDGSVEFLSKNYKKRSNNKIKLKLIKENLKIGIVKVHPNMLAEELKPYLKFNGLILEGTGLGHIATEGKILNEIKKVAKKIPVLMTTQTIFGRVNMNVYSTGIKLQEAGVIGNLNDMLAETAFIKMAWLLSNYPRQVKELISKNLKGEINDRILPSQYDIYS